MQIKLLATIVVTINYLYSYIINLLHTKYLFRDKGDIRAKATIGTTRVRMRVNLRIY